MHRTRKIGNRDEVVMIKEELKELNQKELGIEWELQGQGAIE